MLACGLDEKAPRRCPLMIKEAGFDLAIYGSACATCKYPDWTDHAKKVLQIILRSRISVIGNIDQKRADEIKQTVTIEEAVTKYAALTTNDEAAKALLESVENGKMDAAKAEELFRTCSLDGPQGVSDIESAGGAAGSRK